MLKLIDASLDRSRTVLMVFALIGLIGVYTVITIPKESSPDVTVPIVYVSVQHDGISPSDADKLLYKPLEKELQSVDGLKEMKSTASLGYLAVTLEFHTDVDIDKALQDVRQRVSDAKKSLPSDSQEPKVKEINVALFPVMLVTLAGKTSEAELYAVAKDLQDRLEGLPGVLEASIKGKRDEVAEIVVNQAKLDNYGLSLGELAGLVSNNNQLVASEDLDMQAGRFGVQVPGLIGSIDDILNLPIKSTEDEVVVFKDVAVGRLAYKDRKDSARVNGKPAVTLEIKKRIGSNIIQTLDDVKRIIEEVKPYWPEGIVVTTAQDESKEIKTMLNDLFNNVLVATLLVMILILATLGFQDSFLVGLAIPGAFLMGIIALSSMGYTMNMVVLFALILSVGMLVDGAIVVTEYANRRLAEGAPPKQAYQEAAKRMAWPIIASTATTLAVFLPLLFWPGTAGEFMKFLPLTLLFTLGSSLIVALIIVPTVGSVIGRAKTANNDTIAMLKAAETGNFSQVKGMTGRYIRILENSLKHPIKIMLGAVVVLFASFYIYGQLGNGVEFFPEVDADIGMVDIRARGNLSMQEREKLVKKIEGRIFDMPEIESIYTVTYTHPPSDGAKDLIGRIQIELSDWTKRRLANRILAEIEQRTANIPGIIIETSKKQGGPPSGSDVQLQLTGASLESIKGMLEKVRAIFKADKELKDITDTLPLEGIDWQLDIDREKAVLYGTNILSAGSMIRMISGGQKVGSFQPEQFDEEVEILLRYPINNRTIKDLSDFNITTPKGLVPVSNFMQQKAVPKAGNITRIDGKYLYEIKANVVEGVNSAAKITELGEKIKELNWQEAQVLPRFRGDFEEMASTGAFLAKAFMIAIFLMSIILVTQFNNFYQAILIMSAIVLSIVGVLFGLLIRGEAFSIVMSGVGVIALAGIVVNNNIVLIDTYQLLRKQGIEPIDAALRTGAQRLRPVLLTAVTTVLGLMPMVLQWNIDLIHAEFTIGAPSSQWWTQLSTAIVGGLSFATVLTLILTPCMLIIGENLFKKKAKKKELPLEEVKAS